MDTYNGFTERELAYLYMDGEATPDECEALYSAIRNNPELIGEFRTSLLVQKAAFSVERKSKPQASYSSAILQRAGFGSTSQSVKNSYIHKIANSRTFIACLAAGIGILIGFYSNTILYNSKSYAFNEPQTSSKSIQNSAKGTLLQSSASRTESNIIGSGLKQAKYQNQKSSSLPVKQADETENLENTAMIVAENAQVNKINKSETKTPILEMQAQEIAMSNINMKPALRSIITSPIHLNISDDFQQESKQEFVISAGSSQGIGMNPYRKFSQESSAGLSNFDLAIMAKISDNMYLGARVVKENFPIYTKNNNGIFVYEPYILSYGANFESRINSLAISNTISPFYDGYGGYSKSGFMLKSNIGLMWTPESIISIKLGLDGSSLLYRFGNGIKHTEKLGLIYSINIRY